ncbi:MAG: DUF2786 domain-containing protein [Desulfobacterales bacterium]|nr:DUF2786 domain-containing protein [Desulfobacterales bacterium]
MASTKQKKTHIQEELEYRILHGLSCEWEKAIRLLDSDLAKIMQKPMISLRDLNRKLGYWSGIKSEICLNRNFVLNYSWDSVREVLLHEIAHQLAEQVFGSCNDLPHGPKFQKACRLLRANPKASGNYQPLTDRIFSKSIGIEDKIMLRVGKLMALAESQNPYEAEAAMLKAHELIAKYNIDLLKLNENRNFYSVFIGKPALRHHREEYYLARLIQDFYFVQGLWISTYVIEKGKMGRVLEISGTRQNIKISGYIYDFIKHHINIQWKKYNKTNGLNRYRRTDFAVGIIEGFRSKLLSPKKERKDSSHPSALTTVEDPCLKKYIAYKYPHTRSFRNKISNQDNNILQDGIDIGKKLVIFKGITKKSNQKRLLPVK